MDTDLRISAVMVDGIPVLKLSGEVDAYTCPAFREAMVDAIENSGPSLVVSLAEVEYIDSSGLGTLVGGLKRASEHGGKIALVCTTPQITKVFEITGLERVFPIYRDDKEAARSLVSAG